jgi:hypothetical protein
MTTRRGRWDRLRDRDRVRRFGSERADVNAPLYSRQLELGLTPPVRRRRQMTRAELRALGERALREWKRRPR